MTPDLLRLPKRRDVKSLRATLAPVRSGDYVAALFHDPTFGTFRVTAMTYEASGDKTLLLAGLPIDTAGNRAPLTNLHSLSHVSAIDAMTCDGPLFVEVPQVDSVATVTIEHGDVVNVGFSQHPYGSFYVTGQAVARLDANGEDSVVTLGPWILSRRAADGATKKGALASVIGARLNAADADMVVSTPPVPYSASPRV